MPTRVPDPRDVRVREALALRAWALPMLCGAGGAPPSVSPGGWSTFLRAERCGLALLPVGEAVLGEGAATVRRRAAVETQRVLSAGAQLRLIGRLAREGGGSVVVLKGGVPLAEGRPGADLVDVDVLAAADAARALGAALDARGFTAFGRASSHRLPERAASNALPVEIHTGIPGIGTPGAVMERARDTRITGLRVPHPADHLWHLLLHTVTQHTGRRGTLRELVILADALGRCAPEDVAGVEARIAARHDGPALRAQLALAQALHGRRAPRADPFREVAAAAYTLTEHLQPLRLSPVVRATIWETTFLTLARRAGTGPSAADAEDGPARRGVLGRLARRAPQWLAAPPALLFARRALRTLRAAAETE